MKTVRSVAAVLVSYVVVYAIVMLSVPVLTHFFPTELAAGKVPPTFLLWINTGIFALASILGGYLCATMAPSRAGLHLTALFILGEVLGLFFTWRMWGQWPHWYSFAWLLVWPVCLWIGAISKRPSYAVPPVSPAHPIS